MPPKGVKSRKRGRQYKKVLKSIKSEGRYKGRPEDVKRNASIMEMLRSGMSWSTIQAATGCSRATLAKLAKREANGATKPPTSPKRQDAGAK